MSETNSLVKCVGAILVFLKLGTVGFTQTLYNPQLLYDEPGGFYDQDSLRTLSISFYDQGFHDTLVDHWFSQSGLRLPASVSLSDGTELDSVAIRYKGNSTFYIPVIYLNLPKLPLNLDVNEIISGQRLGDRKKIKLANSVFDPTFIKEIVGYNVYRKYLPAPEANHIKVNLQGDYLGLYVNIEAINKQFLEKHFGEDDGILFKCDPIQQFGQEVGPTGHSNLAWLGPDSSQYFNHYKLKSDHGWSEMVRLCNIIENDFDNLDTILNIDRVLWAFAVNTVIANLDSYNGLYQHNYYLYQTADGLFQWIPWDVSEAFVAGLIDNNPVQQQIFEYDPFNGYSFSGQPLSQLVSDPMSHYGKVYTAHIRTVLEESLVVPQLEAEINNLQNICLPAAQSDPNAWLQNGFYSNLTSDYSQGGHETAGVLSTAALRETLLENYQEIAYNTPTLEAPIIEEIGNQKLLTIQAAGATHGVSAMATISPYNSKFREFPMYDDGTNGDQTALDGIYSCPLPYQNSGTEIKFYVRAANANAYALDPPRAEYEFYTYSSPTGIPVPQLPLSVSVFPNPMSNKVTFNYRLNSPGQVNCAIYDLSGKLVSTVINEFQYTGNQTITWTPEFEAVGTYIYKLAVNETVTTGIISRISD